MTGERSAAKMVSDLLLSRREGVNVRREGRRDAVFLPA